MGGALRRAQLCASISLSTLMFVLNATGVAKAETSEEEIRALRSQVEQLTRTVNRLMDAQAQNAADAKAAKKQASQAEVQAAQAKATAADAHAKSGQVPVKAGVWDIDDCSGHRFLAQKMCKDPTFFPQ